MHTFAQRPWVQGSCRLLSHLDGATQVPTKPCVFDPSVSVRPQLLECVHIDALITVCVHDVPWFLPWGCSLV